jgi:cytochrome P450
LLIPVSLTESIGDLAFGESFHAVSDARTHSWISIIFDSIEFMMITAAKKRLAVLGLFESYLAPPQSAEKLEMHLQLSQDKARKRIQLGGDSPRGLEDFFGHMIRTNSITEDEMTRQARTLIVAGSETTAATLTATTYHLLRNPACLAQLKNEIRGTFSSCGEIDGDNTAGLKYLHGVIEEALRLFPPVSVGLPRYSPGAVIDGHFIPAGVTVSNGGYGMTRDSRYWHDPESFRPERWVDEGFHDELRASQPFSTGPRACLGINLAYLELRIILAKVIFTYDLELESKYLKNWNDECYSSLLWKRPELLVKFIPFVPEPDSNSYSKVTV